MNLYCSKPASSRFTLTNQVNHLPAKSRKNFALLILTFAITLLGISALYANTNNKIPDLKTSGKNNTSSKAIHNNTTPGTAITVNPSSVAQVVGLNGTSTALTVTATGVGLTYQWYSNSVASNSGGTPVTLPVGQNYPAAGGIIGYILASGDPGYKAGQIAGLVVSPTDVGNGLEWGCQGTSVSTSTAFGTGLANTNAIIAACAGSNAAQACRALSVNGFSDWYLPSKDEMTKFYNNQDAIGGFANSGYYWCSSQCDATNATGFGFKNGDIGSGCGTKHDGDRARAARSFTITNSFTPLTSTAGTTYYYVVVTGSNGTSATSAVSGPVTVSIAQTITFNTLPGKTYGNGNFAPGATSDNNGVPLTYSSSNNSVATIVNGNIHIVGAGTANITASQAGDATHSAAADVIQQLTVSQAPLTITANNQTKAYGVALPTLTAGYSGFVNSDTQASLTTAPSVTTVATSTSAPGTYAIAASGAVGNNYSISYVPGTLTVTYSATFVHINSQPDESQFGDLQFEVAVDGPVSGLNTNNFSAITTGVNNAAVRGIYGPYGPYSDGSYQHVYYYYVDVTYRGTSGTVQLQWANTTGVTPLYVAGVPGVSDVVTVTPPPPVVVTIGSPSASSTASGPVTFSVDYSGGDPNGYVFANLSPSDINVSTTGSAAVGSIDLQGGGTSFTVTLSGITGNGSFSFSIPPGTSDSSTGIPDNGASSSSVTVLNPVTISSITAASASPVNAATVNYTVTLSKPLTGLSASNFTVTATGTAAGTVSSVSGSGLSYTISLTGVSGDGTLALNFDNGANLSASITNTLPYAGQTYTIDNTAPSIAISSPSVVGTDFGPVTYTVTYPDADFNAATLSTSDITLNTTGTATGTLAVTGSGTTRTVTVSNITGTGTLGISLAAGTAADNAGNLAVAAGPSATFTVTPPLQHLTFETLSSKTYGDTDFSPGASSDNNSIAVTYSSDNSAVATIADGNIHITGAGTANITASQAGDVAHTAAANVTQQLTVNQAPLTITADNQTKVYGAMLPTLTASYSGFVNGDTPASLTNLPILVTSATQGSHVSGNPYTVTASGAVDANYDITYTDGSLTVSTAPLTITADNQTKAYGEALPTLTASYTGLVNGDTQANLTSTPVLSTGATAASHVEGSPYAITASGAADADYSISYVQGNLTITAAQLTVTADNQTKVYGENLPLLTASYSGFVNGDTEANLSSPATLSTIATVASHVAAGPYDISASGATDADYIISYVTGSLTVTSAALTITADDQTSVYGNLLPIFTASYSGFVNGDTQASLNTLPTLSTSATAFSAPARYNTAANGAVDADYNISYQAGSLIITGSANASVTGITAGTVTLQPGSNDTYTASVANTTTTVNITPTTTDANATLKVNDVTVVSGSASNPIALSIGENIIVVKVTAQDGVTTKTYTITLTRAASANSSLTTLKLSPVSPLTIVTGPDYKDYTTNVPNSQVSVKIIPTAQDPTATIVVNGVTVASGAASGSTPLLVGINTVTTLVTAQDGVTQKAYVITVTRAASANAALAGITLSSGTLSPLFATGTTAYTASVPNATTSVAVTPVTADGGTVTVNGTPVTSGATSDLQALTVGANVIAVKVKSQDGTTTKDYTITVTRAASTNAVLTTLKLNPVSPLTIVTGPDYKDYTTNVPNSQVSIKITPTVQDPTATIMVNGVTVASGAASGSIPLLVGTNTVTTLVTAQDGVTTKTYVITITRAASANAALTGIALSSGTLSPLFATGTTGYTVNVPNATTSITLTPTTADGGTVTVNGTPVTSGAASDAQALTVGANAIAVKVKSQDGTTTKDYTITVTRAASTNAALTTLKLSPVSSLTQVSGPDYKDYTTNVPNSQVSIKITPTAQDPTAMIVVNGVTVASGAASGSIPLLVGTNTVTTLVTAQDGVTTKTYVITVTRAASANAALAGVTLSSGTLSPLFASATTGYTADVLNATTSITLTPVTADGGTVTVNGTQVTSGTPSGAQPLGVGPNVITVEVKSQDGTNTKDYTVTVNRAASTNAALTTLKLSPVSPLTLVTGPDYKNYTTNVLNSQVSIKIIPTAQDATATIMVNGVTVASGAASASIPLLIGTNTVTTLVTAQDSITQKSYVITVTRAPADLVMQYQASADPIINNKIAIHQNVSPNGDGNSDVLIIDGITAFPDNKLQIMSRSGNLVYEAKGYDNTTKAFDGHSSTNGKLQQSGTYFYSLEYKDGNEVKRKTGFIVLKY
ncbi:cadherin-like beta sandwich domain-containing protein [Mucilaginibacter sp.]|uniref:cadherin-like beta sandwich domain-containing protein n=1 Tax=Mucilaginibacter sp. TaxID=1882438 RepID=UPI0025CC67A6|nr:cadherin-like beta sandwich domain-containing protein [Mucilaginibacter sp.]